MGNFKTKLARFMYGRYGADELYYALFLFEIIVLVLSTVFQVLGYNSTPFAIVSAVLYAISIMTLVFAIYRMMSRKIDRRRRENMWFLRQKSKFKNLFRSKKRRLSAMDTASHIFRACPHCSATLRLPRKSGKHTVRCPRCSRTFKVKVK
ncbi:MAG: hypothetical protein IJX74_06470 [Clostridia bacterium]|nr:hypothetical protein [Clostridia bacterium]